jgi:NAD(P)-dependent dehydrogenase (short-subunit alcohol dehydrogenase family)
VKDLADRVAVVTGGASGIGRALCLAFAGAGMHVAVADLDEAGMAETAAGVGKKGRRAITVRTDVSRLADVRALADRAWQDLGGVHVLCNNAGIALWGSLDGATHADWEWAIGVNLWGVIHGVRAFTPHLIKQDEGHIVNTASVAGLISPPGSGAYNVTKHGVVALSESLYHDLRERNSKVGVSVLCPAYVPTGIVDSERNRPKDLPVSTKSEATLAREAMLRKAVASGKISADQVAQSVVAAIKDERFYILTHPRIKGAIQARMEDVLNDRAPRNPLSL